MKNEMVLIASILFIALTAILLLGENDNSDNLMKEFQIKTINVSAVGDIVMGNTYPSQNLPKNDGKELFEPAKEYLQSADIAFGNLECALCDEGTLRKNVVEGVSYAFKTPEKYGVNLFNAGFDVMNIANNHIRDFGDNAVERTKEILDTFGMKYTGFEGDIARCEINGIKVSVIGFSIYSQMYDLTDIESSKRVVEEESNTGRIVIVTFHGGTEGQKALHVKDETEYMYGEYRGNTYKFCHAVIDAGADLVVGHGPHVPRGIELYKGRIIAYSLGNFMTYAGINVNGINGYAPLLNVTLNEDGQFKSGNIFSFVQKKGVGIELDTANSSAKLMRDLSANDFPESKIIISSEGIITYK